MLQNAEETRGTVTRGSQPGTERFLIAAQTRPPYTPRSDLAGRDAGADRARRPAACVGRARGRPGAAGSRSRRPSRRRPRPVTPAVPAKKAPPVDKTAPKS